MISKLEWFHNPTASHKIILLKLWLSLMCGVQVWQHSAAFVVQLMQEQIKVRQTSVLEITNSVVPGTFEIFIHF